MYENKKPDSNYAVFILSDNIDKESINILEGMSTCNFSVKVIETENKYKKIAMNTSAQTHITSSTYMRFDIPFILPNFDKILYIDTDTIVMKDLSELYNTNLRDTYVGAVLETGNIIRNIGESLGISRYFNAGVLLINLKKYKEDPELYNRIQDLSKQQFIEFDQCILNIAFDENVTWLHPKYNVQQVIYDYSSRTILKYFGHKTKDIIGDNAVIIHYCSWHKPWKYRNNYTQKLWEKYYYNSIYKNEKLQLKYTFMILYYWVRGHLMLKKTNTILRAIKNKLYIYSNKKH